MADIFFSYRSVDRDRVRLVRDALTAHGFDVFWDQAVPSGVDWDTWIRQHLAQAKCTLVFWSLASVSSANVRHEATVAMMQGKLMQILLDPLTPDQFPMGLYSQQGVNLSGWTGDVDHQEWRKAIEEIEAKLTPAWVQRQLYVMDAALTAERARSENAESRVKALQKQINKEVNAQDGLRRARDVAVDEVAALKDTVARLDQTLAEANANGTDRPQDHALQARLAEQEAAQKTLKHERDQFAEQAAALTAKLNELTAKQSLQDPEGPGSAEPSSPGPQPADTPVVARIKSPALSNGIHPLGGRAAVFVAIGIVVAVMGSLVLAANWPKPAPPPPIVQAPTSATGLFLVAGGNEAYDDVRNVVGSYTATFGECEQNCMRSTVCKVFTYSKPLKLCYQFPTAKFRANSNYDTGMRK